VRAVLRQQVQEIRRPLLVHLHPSPFEQRSDEPCITCPRASRARCRPDSEAHLATSNS
jgi:hypothetical protein